MPLVPVLDEFVLFHDGSELNFARAVRATVRAMIELNSFHTFQVGYRTQVEHGNRAATGISCRTASQIFGFVALFGFLSQMAALQRSEMR
jgi:hypothetical protein